MKAASSTSRGIDSKNCFMMKTLPASMSADEPAPPMMTPHSELRSVGVPRRSRPVVLAITKPKKRLKAAAAVK